MATVSDSPSGRLRNAVRECHERLDKTAYAAAVMDASLPLAHYASFLRALYALHDGLEQLVELSGSPILRAAYAAGPAQRERLERDLTFLNTDRYGVDVAALHALVLAQQVRLRMQAPHGESSLLGTIYVLEGAQFGGLVQARALARRPELQRGGLAYLKGVGSDTASSSPRPNTGCARRSDTMVSSPSGPNHNFSQRSFGLNTLPTAVSGSESMKCTAIGTAARSGVPWRRYASSAAASGLASAFSCT